MNLSPQVLLVDDNPADVALAKEALAGSSFRAASAAFRTGSRHWRFCIAPDLI
jgi:CheY-like chemotaxis protein